MMWTARWILDAYEQGAQPVRWDMYMAYPELRSYFDEIETRFEEPAEVRADHLVDNRSGTKGNLCTRLAKGFGG